MWQRAGSLGSVACSPVPVFVSALVVLAQVVLAHVILAGSAAAQHQLHPRGLSGRSAGLAGAGSAAVTDASAVVANPAMLSRLGRFSLQLSGQESERDPVLYSIAGDFEATTERFEDSATAAFVAWKPGGEQGRFGVGIGVHRPMVTETRWGLDFFRRYDTREERVELEEASGALAWRAGRWSFAAGPRYVSGDVERTTVMPVGSPIATAFRADADVRAVADVSGWGWSAAVDHQRERWGAALVVRSEVGLSGLSSGAEVEMVDFFLADEALRDEALAIIEPQLAILAGFDFPLAADLPLETILAGWITLHPRVDLHLDLARQEWSEASSPTLRFNFRNRFPTPVIVVPRFDDTLAARVGAEVTLSPALRLFLGYADEESRIPQDGLDPGFPEGDATVLGVGLGWRGSRLGLEVGYDQVDLDDQVRPGDLRNETLSSERSELTVSLRVTL